MATLGFKDLRDLTYPSLWDLAEMKKVQLADGSSFDRVIADVSAALNVVNTDLLRSPHYSGLFSAQDNVEVEYPTGVTNGVQESSEYSVPNPGRGKTTGHSLPVKAYDRSLGWTIRYLMNARTSGLDSDVRSLVTDVRSHFQKALLTRFFKMEGETVGVTANASVAFADGGTLDATYIPPASPEGKTFLYTHDHYLRMSAINDTNLATAVLTLMEHGHVAPFDVIAAEADAATWKAVTGWKAPLWADVAYQSSTTERARISDISNYFGYIETIYGLVRVWLTPRVPTLYWGLYKDYGSLDRRSPLRVRVNKNVGWGWQLLPGTFVNAPTHLAVAYSEFGVGVGEDRTNGVLVYTYGSGDYITPTIS